MRFSIAYLVLFAFTFLSLTPSGVSIAELRADDGFELDDLDLGIDDVEDEQESGTKGSASEESEDDLADLDDEEAPAEKSAGSSEKYASNGKKVIAFYIFEDQNTQKNAAHVAAETAAALAENKEYDYVGMEASFSSSSKSDSKTAMKKFEEGKALYDDFNMEEAVAKFQAAKANVESSISNADDLKLLADIIFYIGASFKLLDEDEQAASYFATYIAINPDAQPDEMVFSPEVISAFNETKEDLGSLPKGSVKFQSSPEGALVFVDGKVAGMTPTTVRGLSQGTHYYRIHKNGFRDAAGSVAVKEGKTANVDETVTKLSSVASLSKAEADMKEDFGSVTMMRRAEKAAAEVDADNVLAVYAALGEDGAKLAYKGYMINIEKKEYKKVEAEIVLPKNAAASSSAALKEFNKALINDPYEYKAIADLAMQEANELGLVEESPEKDGGKDKEKKPVYKEWWLWTVVGVVVVGAAVGVGVGLSMGSGSGSKGGSLDVNFQ